MKMGIALTALQLDQVLKRARCIADSDERQVYFDRVAAALRDLDPPSDHEVRRAAVTAFLPFNIARTPRTTE
jgi:hypothetical protein